MLSTVFFPSKTDLIFKSLKRAKSTICQDVRVLFWSPTDKIYWHKLLSITLVLLSSKKSMVTK